MPTIIKEAILNIKSNWKEQWSKPLRNELILTFAFGIGVNLVFDKFLVFIESRKGAVLNDPILQHFNAVDLSTPIFSVLIFSLVLSYWFFIKKPDFLILAFKSYGFFVLFRIGAMYLTPLDPPQGFILLKDPIVEAISSSSTILTRDLFYSGHTGDMFLMLFLAKQKAFKIFLAVASTFIVTALLIQKAHYSIDVYAAPFFAFCALQAAKKFSLIKE